MADENNLVPENDDTSALFVSSQKKKKAEEEARRRAEEEQAKRDAAAAEVRRMEQEVEERRKKAEEERLALENEEKMTAEERAKVAAQKAADKAAKESAAANKAPGSAKIPAVNSKLFIMIGAVVAVLAIVFIIVGVVGKGGKSNYSELGSNGEYVPKATGFDIKLLYPNDVYAEVTEKKVDDDNLQVFFKAKKNKDVTTNIVLTTFKDEDSKEGDKKMLNSNIPLFSPDDIQKGLTETAKQQLTGLIPDATVKEETTAQYSDDNPTAYTYDCTFTSGKYKSGTARALIVPNSAGEYKVMMVCCFKESSDDEGVVSMRDVFVKNNSTSAFAMPGALPPTAIDVEGMLENHDMHMGLRVPKDRFVKFPHTTNYDLWCDINGATIIVQAYDLDMYSEELAYYDIEKMLEFPKEQAKTGINNFNTSVSGRVLLTESTDTDNKVAYDAEFKDVIGGVTYWERYRMSIWTDVTTDKVYWANIIMLAPEKNKTEYKNIFEKTLSSLEDI